MVAGTTNSNAQGDQVTQVTKIFYKNKIRIMVGIAYSSL
jgi:hypothetical protein